MPALPSVRAAAVRRCTAVLAAGVLLCPALAGCATRDSARESATGHARDIHMVPRDRVREGGTLRWAVDALPVTPNTFHSAANAATDQLAAATLPALFAVDSRGRPRMNPDYLRSAEIVGDRDHPTVVYRLHPRARWSDGRALGVRDFVAQWQALNGADGRYPAAHQAGYERIGKIEAGADDHEVRVVFARPYADWKALFTPLFPESVMRDPAAFRDRSRRHLEVSAGPFAVGGVDRAGGTVTLERNPEWWGDRAKLERIVLTEVPTDRRGAALAAGRVDLAEVTAADARRVEEAARRERPAGHTVRRALGPSYTQLSLNGESGPLADLRVRRALAHAIDRGALARAALDPTGLPGHPLGSHLRLLDQDGYQDNSGALGERDVESAREVLADAGWSAGGGSTAEERRDAKARHRPAADPARTLRLVVPAGPGTASLRSTGERITGMLRQVGVEVTVRRVPRGTDFAEVIEAGDFDLALRSWPASPFPATDARPVYAKPEVTSGGGLRVGQNYSRLGTDQINQLFEAAAGELDRKAHADLLRRADARIWAVAGSLPLYQRAQLVAVDEDLANAGAFGMESPRYEDIGFRKR